ARPCAPKNLEIIWDNLFFASPLQRRLSLPLVPNSPCPLVSSQCPMPLKSAEWGVGRGENNS
ncbi:hypothetical protein, partial [uncultured Nostoc sp.]|uniref:hypothetical protein n=1 Tax=uncultured Nostoc sp. TaxID=340711 RepID=UPI0035CBAE75